VAPLAIAAAGMVTGVGLTHASTSAAIRCGLNRFVETRFMGDGGEWLIGSPVSLAQPWRGIPKLVQMVVPALRECLAALGDHAASGVPLVLCVAELDRPGRFANLEEELYDGIETALDVRFHHGSTVIARGRVGVGAALRIAARLIQDEHVPACIVAASDTLLVGPTISGFLERKRLLTADNSNGFIPGEAAAAVLVRPGRNAPGELACIGVGFGTETATIESDEPLRAAGLTDAIKKALADAGATTNEVDYRLTDVNGEQYWFKEASLAMARTVRPVKEDFPIWHPADSIGEVGAAAGPAVLAVALAAARKRYAPGDGVLCQFGSDGPERAAAVLRHLPAEAR
jgi:3-oxoacyl-[acyl-carrier-protein] synthase-1